MTNGLNQELRSKKVHFRKKMRSRKAAHQRKSHHSVKNRVLDRILFVRPHILTRCGALLFSVMKV